MSPRILCLALLLASSAMAQLQLRTIPGPGLEEPAGDILDIGSVPTGEIRDTRLRIRNLGELAVTIERMRVTGSGFTLEGHPTTPHVVAPGGNVDFRVRFRPEGFGSYSGTLRINDITVMLFASSPRTIALSVEEGGVFRPISSDDLVLFGQVQQGSSETRRFRIDNPAFEAITVESLLVMGAHFAIDELPALPLAIEPGGMLEFAVRYQPSRPGIHQAELWMNDRQFWLEGVGLFPSFPPLEILFESEAASSAEQHTIGVRLAEPAPADGDGEIRIEFAPAVAGTPDDPAIQFLATGERTIPFSVAEGEREAAFDGAASATFQTGTTAGTIHFTVVVGSRVARGTLALLPSAVVVDASGWSNGPDGLLLEIAGYDNTRSASEVAFMFFDSNGRSLTTEPIRADVAEAFTRYFAATQVGGIFRLRASFPVTGDASLLGGAEVTFLNNAGPSRVHRINFK